MALRSSFLLSIFLVFVSRLGCFCFCVVFFFNNFRLFGLLGSFLAFAALAAENLSYRSPGNADFNLIGYADDEVVIVQGYNRTLTPPTVTILAPGFRLSSISCRLFCCFFCGRHSRK